MNFFMFWVNEAGEKELITPSLDGTILPGVTRDVRRHAVAWVVCAACCVGAFVRVMVWCFAFDG
jgi:hypothetical protein